MELVASPRGHCSGFAHRPRGTDPDSRWPSEHPGQYVFQRFLFFPMFCYWVPGGLTGHKGWVAWWLGWSQDLLCPWVKPVTRAAPCGGGWVKREVATAGSMVRNCQVGELPLCSDGGLWISLVSLIVPSMHECVQKRQPPPGTSHKTHSCMEGTIKLTRLIHSPPSEHRGNSPT